MTDEVKIYVYGSCHFLERLDSDEAVGTGGYGIVINANGKQLDKISRVFPLQQMHEWTSSELLKD